MNIPGFPPEVEFHFELGEDTNFDHLGRIIEKIAGIIDFVVVNITTGQEIEPGLRLQISPKNQREKRIALVECSAPSPGQYKLVISSDPEEGQARTFIQLVKLLLTDWYQRPG